MCCCCPAPAFPRSERLKIQVWDKDILEADDAIAEGYLDLQPAFRQALRTQRRVVLWCVCACAVFA